MYCIICSPTEAAADAAGPDHALHGLVGAAWSGATAAKARGKSQI